MDRVIAVGGFPEPIGGVTNFIFRLADSNCVAEVIDLYPHENKVFPKDYLGRYYIFNSMLTFLLKYFFLYRYKGRHTLFFNFSTPKSLVYLFLFPKRQAKFTLLLHHGVLKTRLPAFFVNYCLRRFDVIYYLSDAQKDFFVKYGVSKSILRRTVSYIPVSIPKLVDVDSDVVDYVEANRKNYCVISGYGKEVYNHHWAARFFSESESRRHLLIFLYGDIDSIYLSELKSYASGNPRIKIFYNKSSHSFNYALCNAEMYLRPTRKDSFGIAVADAINFGVPVLASSVCKRYPGAHVFELTNYQGFSESVSAFISNIGSHTFADNITASHKFSFD